MSRARAFSAALIAGVLLSCAPSSGIDRPGDPANLRGCREHGRIERRGMLGVRICVTPYVDGGRACTDSGQCAGRCLLDYDSAAVSLQSHPVGREAAGRCEADNRTFGCHAEILDGRITQPICVD